MNYGLKLNNRLFLFWFGSLLLTLLLIGLLFRYMLTELHQENAEKQITLAYSALQKRISMRIMQTQRLAMNFASHQEVIASSHLIQHYEDINNYQAIIFDVEKRKLAHQIGRLIQTNDLEYAFLYDGGLKLASLAVRNGNSVILMHSTYKNSEQSFMQSALEDNNFLPLSVLPATSLWLNTSFEKASPVSRLISSDGEFHIESIVAITHKKNEQSEIMGWAHFIDTLDNTFIDNVMQRFNLEYTLVLPDGERIGTLVDVMQDASNKSQLPVFDFKSNAPVKWNANVSEEYFAGDALISLADGSHALITIGVQKSSLVLALNLFVKAMLFAVIFIVFILAPFGFMFLRKAITIPITQLVDGVKSLRGKGVDQNIDIGKQDELVFLAESVNTMARVITERENALLESEARVRLLLNSTAEAIYGIDMEGNCTFVNQACLDMLGYENVPDLLGRNMHDLIHYNYSDGRPYPVNECHIYQAFKEQQGTHIDNEVLWRKDGSSFPSEYWSYPIFEEGVCVGAVVTFLDITARRQADEILRRTQKMDALGKLTGGIAHDFNNMLGVILGYSELMKNMPDLGEKQRNHITEIFHAGERAKKLTDKLLSFSRKDVSEAARININQLLQQEQHMLEKTLTVRIELQYKLEENLWSTWLDKSELDDAVINMSINAMHAMPSGGLLTLSTSNTSLTDIDVRAMNIPAGDYVLLSLADTGTGMSQGTLQHIFEPFYTTKKEKGTGLGMSQVYGFVQRSKGAIRVYSELDHGTRISLYFPRYHSTKDVVSNHFMEAVPDEDLSGHATILVVDDEPALRNLAQEILESQGYKVLSVDSGHAALEVLAKERIDLMLSDVIMPEMGGYELAAIVRDKYPHIVIQMASGFAETQGMDKATEDLYEHRLQKPFSSTSLLRRVKEQLVQLD